MSQVGVAGSPQRSAHQKPCICIISGSWRPQALIMPMMMMNLNDCLSHCPVVDDSLSKCHDSQCNNTFYNGDFLCVIFIGDTVFPEKGDANYFKKRNLTNPKLCGSHSHQPVSC